MQNIILLYCRNTHEHSPEFVAAQLGISVKQYSELEAGKALLNEKQVRQLEKLYNVKGHYFYQAALQLDLLLACNEVVMLLKERIAELEAESRKSEV